MKHKILFGIVTLILLVATMTSALAVLDDALSSFSYNDGATPLVDDGSAGNDITTNTATRTLESGTNYLYDFDSTDYQVLGNDDAYDSLTALTLCAWVNEQSTGTNEKIVGSASDGVNAWQFYLSSINGKPRILVSDGSGSNWEFTTMDTYTIPSTGLTHLCGTWSAAGSPNLFVNGDDTTYTHTNGAANTVASTGTLVDNAVQIGAFKPTRTEHWDGYIDQVMIYDRVLTDAEILELYNSGTVYDPFESVVNDTTNFSTVETGSFSFDNPVTISNTYGVVNSITFNNTFSNSSPYYFAASLTTYDGSGLATCRITIDGVEAVTNDRSLSSGTYGNIALVTPAQNFTLGEHTINTECTRDGGANPNLDYVVNNSQLTEFLLFDTTSNSSITYSSFNNSAAIPINTTNQLLGTFNFTTSNTTNTTNKNFLVTQGILTYNFDVDSDISAYFIIEETGEQCGPYIRGGSAGSSGSVGASCLFKELNSSTNYTLGFYGNTSVGTGSFTNLASNLYEILVNDTAADITILNKTVPAATLTEVANITVSNHLGGGFNIFSEASLIVNSSTSQDAYFYLSNSVNTSNFYRTLSGEKGNIVIQNLFSENGISDKTVSLYAYCPSGCDITGGDLNAFVTDAATVSTGEFVITAYNAYNDSEILSFNATIGGSRLSTTNGTINAIGQGTVNVIVEAQNFFSNTTSHDTTTNLNASLTKYTEIRAIEFLGGAVSNFTVNTSTESYTTTNGVAYLPVNSDNTSVTINGDTIAGQTDNVNQTQTYNFTVFGERSILINIYNGTTNNYLTQAVSVNVISDDLSFTNVTSNGTLYLTLLEPNDYELRFNSTGYNTRSVFLTVNDDSTTEVDVYMTVNDTVVTQRVQVLSFEGGIVEGAVVRLQKEIIGETGNFLTVDEKITNSEGETAFKVLKSFNDYYRFIVVYQDEVKLTSVKTFFIPEVDEVISLSIDTSTVSGVEILGLSITDSLVFSGANESVATYTWVDAKNEITGARMVIKVQDLNVSTITSDVLYDSGIITGFSGNIVYTLPVVNDTRYFVKTYIVFDTYEELRNDAIKIFGYTVSIDRNKGLLLAAITFVIIILLTLNFGPLFSGVLGFVTLIGLGLVGLVNIPIIILTSFLAFLFIVFVRVRGGGNG